MRKKYTILIPLFILGMVLLDFSIVDRPYHVGRSYAQRCRDYNPTHRTAIDLWIRNDIPRYSFRTGEWVLGKKIGVIQMNSEFQMINSKTVGLTQVWMEICFKLPDGRVVGGTGYWIWAGQAGALENVTELSPQSNYYRKRRYFSFSFIRNACAQTDTDTGPSREMKTQLLEETGSDTVRKIEDNTQDIKEQLNNWKLVPLKYLSLYFVLLIGMIVGSAWDWLNLKPSEHTSNSKNVFYKNALKKITGSLISFSFFIGPVMGIGEMGFTISSAILAFHFGLVHYDPTELVYTLRSKYSTSS
jgi:hypothetical protein